MIGVTKLEGMLGFLPTTNSPDSLVCGMHGQVTVEKAGVVFEVEAEALLNATGRAPNVHDVGLEKVSYVK